MHFQQGRCVDWLIAPSKVGATLHCFPTQERHIFLLHLREAGLFFFWFRKMLPYQDNSNPGCNTPAHRLIFLLPQTKQTADLSIHLYNYWFLETSRPQQKKLLKKQQ